MSASCLVIRALGGSGKTTHLGFAWVQTLVPSGPGCEAEDLDYDRRRPSIVHLGFIQSRESGKFRHYRKLGKVGTVLMTCERPLGTSLQPFFPFLLEGRHGSPPGLFVSPPKNPSSSQIW